MTSSPFVPDALFQCFVDEKNQFAFYSHAMRQNREDEFTSPYSFCDLKTRDITQGVQKNCLALKTWIFRLIFLDMITLFTNSK